MVRLDPEHFQVRNMRDADALRRRLQLQELGRAVSNEASSTELARWTRSYYVTQKSDPRDEWMAWLKSEEADREILAALAHPHLVLPQDGNPPWVGVNIEFNGPRMSLRQVLLDENRALLEAVHVLVDAEVWILVKSVRPVDHRSASWETETWPQWQSPEARAFSEGDAARLREVVETDVGPPSPSPGHVTEPAIVFAWELSRQQILGWGHDLPHELVRRLMTAVPLLRLLAGN